MASIQRKTLFANVLIQESRPMRSKDRKLDRIFLVGGVPSAAVTDLGATPGSSLSWSIMPMQPLRWSRNMGRSMHNSISRRNHIRVRIRSTTLYRCGTVLVADSKLPNQVAYDIVKTIFEHKQDMIRAHAESRNFNLEYQTPGRAVIPFHPGAKKYFDEKGIKAN